MSKASQRAAWMANIYGPHFVDNPKACALWVQISMGCAKLEEEGKGDLAWGALFLATLAWNAESVDMHLRRQGETAVSHQPYNRREKESGGQTSAQESGPPAP